MKQRAVAQPFGEERALRQPSGEEQGEGARVVAQPPEEARALERSPAEVPHEREPAAARPPPEESPAKGWAAECREAVPPVPVPQRGLVPGARVGARPRAQRGVPRQAGSRLAVEIHRSSGPPA